MALTVKYIATLLNCYIATKKRIKIAFLLAIIAFLSSSTAAYAQSVVINELLPHPTSGGDWIELYNKDQIEVDLEGWKMEDSTSEVEVFATGTKIASGPAFLVVSVGNRLNNGGDTIKLKNSQGADIDVKSYSQDPGEDIAIGRYPDGEDGWGILTSPTKGGANSPLVPTNTPSPTTSPTEAVVPDPTNTPKPEETEKEDKKQKSNPTFSPTTKKTTKEIFSADDEEENIFESTEFAGSVLGEDQGEATSATDAASQEGKNNPIILIAIFLGGGTILIFAAVILSIKQKKATVLR